MPHRIAGVLDKRVAIRFVASQHHVNRHDASLSSIVLDAQSPLVLGAVRQPIPGGFCLSAILVNHGWRAPDAAAATHHQVAITLPDGLKDLDRAKEVLRQVNLAGEVDFFHDTAEGFRIIVSRPARKITINVNSAARTADVAGRPAALAERLVYLHKYPGPHNANIRGNWPFTRVWGILADGTAYLLLLVLSRASTCG